MVCSGATRPGAVVAGLCSVVVAPLSVGVVVAGAVVVFCSVVVAGFELSRLPGEKSELGPFPLVIELPVVRSATTKTPIAIANASAAVVSTTRIRALFQTR